MEKINWELTEHTPKVVLDPENQYFEISGESRPENVSKFYEPIIQWIKDYSKHVYLLTSNGTLSSNTVFTFKFSFEYFNSSSAKFIMDILMKLKEFNDENSAKFEIIWEYDEPDEDMLSAGEEFEDMTGIKFTYKAL